MALLLMHFKNDIVVTPVDTAKGGGEGNHYEMEEGPDRTGR